MKKILTAILISTLCLVLFAACGGSKEPAAPTLEQVQADLDNAGAFVDQAEYTNANGYVYTVENKELEIQLTGIAETFTDDAFFVKANATLSDADWTGTALVTVTYENVNGTYEYRSFYFEDAVIEPSVPLDFEDPEFLDYLESIRIRYKLETDKNGLSGNAYISSDSVKSLEVLELIGTDDALFDERYETYLLQVEFNDGMILKGKIFFDYMPYFSNQNFNTYERWSIPATADFETVGG